MLQAGDVIEEKTAGTNLVLNSSRVPVRPPGVGLSMTATDINECQDLQHEVYARHVLPQV